MNTRGLLMDLSKLNKKIKEDYITILESGEFNKEYYLNQYNLDENIDCILHFLETGVHNGFNPNSNFDTKYYLKYNRDVKNSNVNPFVHYIKYGFDECRIPKFLSLEEINNLNLQSLKMVEDYLVILYSNQFDSKYYVTQNNINQDINPIVHFLQIGVHEGFNPNPYFDISYYLEHNLNARNSNMNPFIYYLKYDRFNFMGLKKYTLEDILSMKLNHTLKGKNGFLFLINDGNSEIRQHFDFNYVNQFDSKQFLDSYYFKKNLFKKNKIEYHFFNIPDKSVVCKRLLPFYNNNTTKIKRNVDDINEIIDFENYLNHSCYYKFDSHLNFKGGEILSYLFINYIDESFNIKKWNNMLDSNFIEEKYFRNNDLLYPQNWSYSHKERQSILKQIQNDYETVIKSKTKVPLEIKEEFKFCRKRPSFFFNNPESITKKTALIFRDSTFEFLMEYFSFYFRNMFVYWDHGSVDDKLIKYINPDIILEIRMERFIDNLIIPNWVSQKKDIFE